MAPLMALVLIATILIAYLWINKNNHDYLIKQQTLRQQDQKQFQLITDMLRSRVESWFESFIHFQANHTSDVKDVAKSFQREFDYMQLNWQLNNLWLFTSDREPIYSTSQHIPLDTLKDIEQVIRFQTSVSQIRCKHTCQQHISMPMLTYSGEMIVLSISSSLLESLAYLNRSTLAQLALISISKLDIDQASFKVKDMRLNTPISSKNRKIMQAMLDSLPANLYLDEVLTSGYKLDNQQDSLLFNLIPVEQSTNNNTYVLFVHDISKEAVAHQDYQIRVLSVSVVVVILSMLALFFMTFQFRRRLLLLAQQLPLLAEKKYTQFKQHKFAQNSLFVDEIELLQESASLLGKELESLDHTIEQNTRELEHIAMNDWLTGLPNRNMLNIRLKKLIPTLGGELHRITVMFLDFDQFRKINDTHGHDVGDTFLIHAAQRISGCLINTDMLFRFGGDEFVLIALEKNNKERAPLLAARILESFREPIAIDELLFYSSTSIGIASTQKNTMTIDDLIRQSDLAMYNAKDAGGGQYSIFNDKMQASALRKVEIENEVREALECNEFSFALQPQIEISTGKLLGFEALIRWFHPTKGYVPPDEFIPLIENSGHMINLGYWGMKRAFSILQKLDDMGFSGFKIAVNLSANQFLDPDLIPFLEGQLKAFSRNASQIELELTERTLVADIEQTLDTMNKLKKMGFTFSIDDFGTGYSSLAYLKQMPVDIIKIDRSFVSAMHENSADMQIVSSIIAMVKSLGMTVIAEGIENAEQIKMLNNLQCMVGQGYFISRPIPEADLVALLSEKLSYGVWDNLDNLTDLT